MSRHHPTRDAFIEEFGGVFEHSPWIAARAYDSGLPDDWRDAQVLHRALCAIMRAASHEQRRDLILAHPDLAGALARAGRLTQDSAREQAGAGLSHLTAWELARFEELNAAYKTKFGFPFIIAVRGRSKDEIRDAFEARLANTPEQEFADALTQIEQIAYWRLADLLA